VVFGREVWIKTIAWRFRNPLNSHLKCVHISINQNNKKHNI
jgi:hypothetical protein